MILLGFSCLHSEVDVEKDRLDIVGNSNSWDIFISILDRYRRG
jgi:hypothetical protein